MEYRLSLSIAFFLFSSLVTYGQEKDSRPPNIIFILTDDQGWGDAAFAGHPYAKTPNLDRLAKEGTWFHQFYTAATVCSPSRTAFMTSHYPAKHHIHGHFATHEQNASRHMPDWLEPSVPNIASILKSRGYATGHFGKWHLGNNPGAPPPEAYGFDVSKTTNSNGPSLGDEGKEAFFRAQSTSLIIDETIAFIRANQDRPFFTNVWTLLPHALLKPTPEQLAVYGDLNPSPDDFGSTPWMKTYLTNAKDLQSQMQTYCASLTDLDTQIGRLLDELDHLKLTNDTLIFFSSDNGAEDYRVGNASNAGVGSTGILRARKRSMYEGGIRTFGIVRWPGKVPAGVQNKTTVVGAVDFLPTVCNLTNTPLPTGLNPDGEDMSQAWLGKVQQRTKPLFWEWLFSVQGPKDGYMPPTLAVRSGDWKLFINHDGTEAELYNIPNDPSEKNNLAKDQPEQVTQLTKLAMNWSHSLPPSTLRDKPQIAKSNTTTSKTPTTPKIDRPAIFRRWDENKDNQLSFEEYKSGLKKPDAATRFKTFDLDKNESLSLEEFTKPNNAAGQPNRGEIKK